MTLDGRLAHLGRYQAEHTTQNGHRNQHTFVNRRRAVWKTMFSARATAAVPGRPAGGSR